jgi:hypothetical protein
LPRTRSSNAGAAGQLSLIFVENEDALSLDLNDREEIRDISSGLTLVSSKASSATEYPERNSLSDGQAGGCSGLAGDGVENRINETHDDVEPSGPRVLARGPVLSVPFRRRPIRLGCERDYRIRDVHHVGSSSLREKVRANLGAIRILKITESERREATVEEQEQLVRCCGWGAMPQIFEETPSNEWKQAAQELQEILTSAELASARASTPNAHYTSPDVIRFMWSGVQRIGVREGAEILEPSSGIGHFFGFMPESLQPNTSRTGIELDTISARIASKLYPDSAIIEEGAFERSDLPNNFYDLVIGNVPFGNVPIHDPDYRRQPALTWSLHDYFLVKSLDKTRPRGLVALITSAYTLDKRDDSVRRHLAQRAHRNEGNGRYLVPTKAINPIFQSGGIRCRS